MTGLQRAQSPRAHIERVRLIGGFLRVLGQKPIEHAANHRQLTDELRRTEGIRLGLSHFFLQHNTYQTTALHSPVKVHTSAALMP